jgi:hypothetical protein
MPESEVSHPRPTSGSEPLDAELRSTAPFSNDQTGDVDVPGQRHDPHPSAAAPTPRRWPLILTAMAGLTVFALAWVEGPAGLAEAATGAEVRHYVENNLTSIGWKVLAESLALTAFMMFASGLTWLIHQTPAAGRLAAYLAAGSSGLLVVWYWLLGSLDAIPLVLADETGKLNAYSDDALIILEPLGRLGESMGDIATVPRGLMILAVSLLALPTRFLPRWLAIYGMATAAAALLGIFAAWVTPALGASLLIGLFAFYLWLLLLSVVLLVPAFRTSRLKTRHP